MSRRAPRGGPGPEWPSEPDDSQEYGDQGAAARNGNGNGNGGYDGNGRGPSGQDQRQYGQYAGPGRGAPAGYGQPQPYGGQGGNGYGQQGHAQQGYGSPGYQPGPGQGYDNQPTQTVRYQGPGPAHQGNGDPRGGNGYPGNGDPRGRNGYPGDGDPRGGNGYPGNGDPRGRNGYPGNGDPRGRNGYPGNGDPRGGNGYQGNGDPRGYPDRRAQGNMRRYEDPQGYDDQRYQQVPGQGPGGPALDETSLDGPLARKVRFRRTRRLFRLRSVRIVSAVVALFLVWVTFSFGQAAFKNNGQGFAANAAEWARDHGLGPVVTFGEWLSYNPPPKGGKPSFSLAVPSGEAVSPSKPAKGKAKNAFVPDIPATLKSLAADADRWRRPVAPGGEREGRAGDPDHVPARRDVHLSGQRHRVDRPAAGQVLAAPGHGRPGAE